MVKWKTKKHFGQKDDSHLVCSVYCNAIHTAGVLGLILIQLILVSIHSRNAL